MHASKQTLGLSKRRYEEVHCQLLGLWNSREVYVRSTLQVLIKIGIFAGNKIRNRLHFKKSSNQIIPSMVAIKGETMGDAHESKIDSIYAHTNLMQIRIYLYATQLQIKKSVRIFIIGIGLNGIY